MKNFEKYFFRNEPINPKVNEYYGIREDDMDWEPDVLPEVKGKKGNPVLDISVSQDGSKVASADGRIHIWDYRTGKLTRSFFTPSKITSVSFDKSGDYVVSGNANGLLQVWNVATGKIHRQFFKS